MNVDRPANSRAAPWLVERVGCTSSRTRIRQYQYSIVRRAISVLNIISSCCDIIFGARKADLLEIIYHSRRERTESYEPLRFFNLRLADRNPSILYKQACMQAGIRREIVPNMYSIDRLIVTAYFGPTMTKPVLHAGSNELIGDPADPALRE
jgi:hypothetical protein